MNTTANPPDPGAAWKLQKELNRLAESLWDAFEEDFLDFCIEESRNYRGPETMPSTEGYDEKPGETLKAEITSRPFRIERYDEKPEINPRLMMQTALRKTSLSRESMTVGWKSYDG